MKTNTKIIEQIIWKCAWKYLKQWFKKTKCKRHTIQSLMLQQSLMGTESCEWTASKYVVSAIAENIAQILNVS